MNTGDARLAKKAMTDEEPSYIGYESFLDLEFSAIPFASSLVTSANDANDTPVCTLHPYTTWTHINMK